MKSLTMDSRKFAYMVAGICLMLSMTVLVMHAPGQVSMDTSIQLYEAKTGISVSWSPPFMSALLRWLGGGKQALAGFVLINTLLLYGSWAALAGSMARQRAAHGGPRLPLWRAVLSLALVVNPIVLIYAGIVWKDVLFASLLTAGATAGIIAKNVSRPWRRALTALSLLLLAAAMLARQQGLFMAPILLVLPIVAMAPRDRLFSTKSAFFVIACFALMVFSQKTAVDASIASKSGKSTDVGFRSVMAFDMAGIVARSPRSAGQFAYPISEAQLAAVRSIYDPSRIDYLDREPLVRTWLRRKTAPVLWPAWWALVRQNPSAYLNHRIDSYSVLLGLRSLKDTLPVHVGVEGNPAYLEAVGLQQGQDSKAQFMYKFASAFFDWPVYRHVFWLLLMAAGALLGLRYAPLPQPTRVCMAVLAAACAALYFSYLPTTIASDFRYLFPAIPLVSLQWLLLLLGDRRQSVLATGPESA